MTVARLEPPSQTAVASRRRDQLAAELRLALAVRDWVNPFDLLATMSHPRLAREIVARLASEVRTSADRRPGRWFLSGAVRAGLFAHGDEAALRREVETRRLESDADDPVLRALRLTLSDTTPDVSGLDESVLRALDNVVAWRGERAPAAEDLRAQVSGRLFESQRDQDIAKMTRDPMFGRDLALADLVAFADPTTSGQAGRALYISGVGGAGKSTLLAHLQKRLTTTSATIATVYLDLDRIDLDPADIVSLDAELLRQLALLRPNEALRLQAMVKRLIDMQRGARFDSPPNGKGRRRRVRSEIVQDRIQSERYSILTDGLAQTGPLLVIVDTTEVASSRGFEAVGALADWLGSVATVMGVHDLAAILAGRDPHVAGGAGLLERLPPNIFRVPAKVVPLGDLPPDAARALLEAHGVPAAIAAPAAAALPGNPLFLRLAADVYASKPETLGEISAAHARGEIDGPSAGRYLVERVIRHLPDRAAQPYVLAALETPRVDARLLQYVVLPAVDGPQAKPDGGKPAAVYRALAAVRWLAMPAPTGRSFTWRPEIRDLALRLIEADPSIAAVAAAVRRGAIAYHAMRSTPADRAFEIYHRLRSGETVRLSRPQRQAALRHLAPVLSTLPKAAQTMLLSDAPAPTIVSPDMTAREWRAWLEGVEGREGQGGRLSKNGRPDEALELYRRRPTRSPGVPPTFVLQALADSGLWDTGEVDAEKVLGEIEDRGAGRLGGGSKSRLYWLTRYELLRSDQPLTPTHRRLLARYCRSAAANTALSMVSLIALVEAQSRDLDVLPPKWLQQKGSMESITRLFLVRANQFDAKFQIRPHLDNLIVTQSDWAKVHGRMNGREALAPQLVQEAQERLRGLDGAPYSAVSQMLRQLAGPAPLKVDRISPFANVLNLRGLLSELHRPLSHSLVAAWRSAIAGDPDGGATVSGLRQTIAVAIDGMSLRPREMQDANLVVERSPSSFFPALVAYSDRSRVLGRLIAALPPTARLKRVATTAMRWEALVAAPLDPRIASDWRALRNSAA